MLSLPHWFCTEQSGYQVSEHDIEEMLHRSGRLLARRAHP